MNDNGCTGHCCEHFWWARSKESQTAYAASVAIAQNQESRDAAYIADMLIPVEERTVNGELQRFFTCKHFDKATRKCSDYASRPLMCEGYPYGHVCTNHMLGGEGGCGSTCGTTVNWVNDALRRRGLPVTHPDVRPCSRWPRRAKKLIKRAFPLLWSTTGKVKRNVPDLAECRDWELRAHQCLRALKIVDEVVAGDK